MKPRIRAYSHHYYEWIHPSTFYHTWKHADFGAPKIKTKRKPDYLDLLISTFKAP